MSVVSVSGLRVEIAQTGSEIVDEIAFGCGRTRPFFACEQAAPWPDFLCLSKGV